MSIRAALDRIVAIQGAISITSPITLTVKKAYKYSPPSNTALPDLPAFTNEWTYLGVDANASMRRRRYTVKMQCMAARAGVEDDRAADIATALWDKAVDDFGHDIMLANTVTLSMLRGGDPTLVFIERDQGYIGFEAWLDIWITDSFTWS